MDLEQLTAHFKRLTATLTPKQIATLAFVFVAVVGVVVGSAYWVNAPSYSLLFSDMDAESAASVVTKLKNDKVPYQLDEGGKTIRVASDRVDELRLQFAGSQAMPASGRIGFEIFDRTAFGTTEFLEHVNYRRALEGELARTIGTIAEVASARVHIAMAKDSLFANDAQPAKASVVLKLKSNRPPSAATVNGIAGLLAASVESLRPESVVIVDTFGRPLSKPADEDENTAGMPVEKQHRIERDLSTRVVALLEPVVGPGHVRVNVSARLNGNSEEQTEERWDPTTVVRSKQLSSDSGGMLSAMQGIAGARANAPPNVSTSPTGQMSSGGAPMTATRSNEVTNFEVSKLTRHTIAPRGQLARLSVAVILDDERTTAKDATGAMKTTNKPRTPAEIRRIQGLVAAAVGLDNERGDQLTVENIAFEEAPTDEPVVPTGIWQKVGQPVVEGVRANALEWTRMILVMLLGLFAILAVLKPMARRALKLPNAQLLETPALAAVANARNVRTVADLEGEIEAELDADTLAKAGEMRRLPVLTKRIAKVAEEEPEHVARLVRSWLSDEEK